MLEVIINSLEEVLIMSNREQKYLDNNQRKNNIDSMESIGRLEGETNNQ